MTDKKERRWQVSPDLDERQLRVNMEKCADFMARMILKYGDQVLADIKAEEAKAEAQLKDAETDGN